MRVKCVVASARRGDRSASDNLIPNIESTQSRKVGARPNPRCGVPSYPLAGIGYLARTMERPSPWPSLCTARRGSSRLERLEEAFTFGRGNHWPRVGHGHEGPVFCRAGHHLHEASDDVVAYCIGEQVDDEPLDQQGVSVEWRRRCRFVDVDLVDVIDVRYPTGYDPKAQEARSSIGACTTFLTDASAAVGGEQPVQDPATMLAFSVCMRAHGIPDFPDPPTLVAPTTFQSAFTSTATAPLWPRPVL